MAIDAPSSNLDSHFADPTRAASDILAAQISAISSHPIVNALMNAVGGLFAVLNEHRQIIAMNKALLTYVGADDPERVLGFRTGEIIGCEHSNETASGCGTSLSCSLCGAAVAVVSCLEKNEPVEQKCAIAISRAGSRQDLVLQVRAVPMQLEGTRIVLMFMQDITQRQNWAAIESTFFHDIGNMLSNLLFLSEALAEKSSDEPQNEARRLLDISRRVVSEFTIQRSLVRTGAPHYKPLHEPVHIFRVLEELDSLFRSHPNSASKRLEVQGPSVDFSFTSDYSLLIRVLHNMISNAIEATANDGEIRLTCAQEDDGIFFSVWNAKGIPQEVQTRIFQRNFSTKTGEGHGLGTFSMKLFGENYLGGKVSFSSSEDQGTEFEFWHPG